MGLIGRQETTGAFAKLDDITSLFDGNATVFNLTLGGQFFFPSNPFTLLVSVAGVIQEPATDYTIVESAIKFTTPPAGGASGFIVVLSTPSTSNVIIREVGSGGGGGGGLGIPISTTPDIPLNSIFHGADILRITQDSTVTLPSGDSTIAFSVAKDVLVEDNKDLIIDDSVDYIPDVVSLSKFLT